MIADKLFSVLPKQIYYSVISCNNLDWKYKFFYRGQLYYWARDAKNSNAEIDYLALHERKIHPVEVKDGPSGKLRSLHLYRETYQPSYSVVFHAGQTGVLENLKIVFLPLYYASAFALFGINFENIKKTP